MSTSHDPDEPPERRLMALREELARGRRARLRHRLWLLRRCEALEAPQVPVTLEQVRREREQGLRQAARKLATLGVRAEGQLPSWVVRPRVPVVGAVKGDVLGRREPLPPLPQKGLSTVFPGGQGGLGLNGMKLFENDDTAGLTTKFGDAASQWEDPPDLRVKVLRQFGKRDLLWDFLTAWQDPDLRVPIPADQTAIRELVLYGTTTVPELSNIARFGDLLYDAWLSGVKLRFTFLTLGLGSSRLVSEADTSGILKDGDGAADDPTLLEAFGDGHYPPWVTQRLVMRQYWSAEYAEGLTPAEGAGSGGLSGSAGPVRLSVLESQRRWVRISLDLQDSRKLQAIYWIAHACAELLVLAAQHALAAHGGVRQNLLAQVLDGIELFNEVDGRNVTADAAYAVGSVSDGHWDPQASGAAWGRAWTMAALGFVHGFRAIRATVQTELTDASWVPTLYLPGVSSYSSADVEGEYTDALTQDFWYKHDFLDAMVSEVARQWEGMLGVYEVGTVLGELSGQTSDYLPSLAEVVGGVDYHWYHGDAKGTGPGMDPLGPLSGVWLAMEVRALSDLLLSHGLDGAVTVFESGVGGDETSTPNLPPVDAVGPTSGGVPTVELNQANEVFRRQLFAAVGGAERTGWHTWMSMGGAFSGYGLRNDLGVEVRVAIESVARASFFAFSRLSVFFRDATWIRLLEPDPLPARSRGQLHASTSGAAGSEDLSIPAVYLFELVGASFGTIQGRDLSGHTYAYIALSDPTLSGTDPVSLRLQPAVLGGEAEPVQVEALPTSPTSSWEVPMAADADPTITLPRYDLEASLPAVVDLPVASDGGGFHLASAHRCMPVLVASRVALRVVG